MRELLYLAASGFSIHVVDWRPDDREFPTWRYWARRLAFTSSQRPACPSTHTTGRLLRLAASLLGCSIRFASLWPASAHLFASEAVRLATRRQFLSIVNRDDEVAPEPSGIPTEETVEVGRRHAALSNNREAYRTLGRFLAA